MVGMVMTKKSVMMQTMAVAVMMVVLEVLVAVVAVAVEGLLSLNVLL